MMNRGSVSLAATLALVLAACASVPPSPQVSRSRVVLAAADHDGTWFLPPQPAQALLVLEHGYARRCANLRTTATRLAAVGVLVLCIDASMAHGNAPLAGALARALATDALRAPDGGALPRRIVVGGHSAGGLFAVHLGAALAASAPERLAGALLLDPVAGDGFAAGLQAISAGGARPLLAIVAAPSRCNANGNAVAALQALPGAIRRVDGSSHGDAEGDDSDWLLVAACGAPRPDATAALQALAVQWLADVAGQRLPN